MSWSFTRRSPTLEPPVAPEVDRHTLDDRTLVALARQDDATAFAVLYERYRMVVYRYIAYRTLRQQVAEDLTAEVFLNAWRAIARYQERGVSVRTWLLRMAHNEVIDHYRTQRRDLPLEDDVLPLSGEGPEGRLALADEQWSLVCAVQQLQPEWQQLILLRFVEGLSFEEIGVILGKQSNACRQMQHRALARLRVLLTEVGAHHD